MMADRRQGIEASTATESKPYTDAERARSSLIEVAAKRLSKEPLVSVTLDDIATDSGLSLSQVHDLFRDMHEIGAAVLDHERASMHAVQQRASQHTSDPLEQLAFAFRLVGENLAQDAIVRAGVRIAAESREYFPERRLHPFRTWEAFVTALLARARNENLLRQDTDLTTATWIIVAAGMGAKDLLTIDDTWVQAPDLLESTVRSVLTLIKGSAGDQPAKSEEAR